VYLPEHYLAATGMDVHPNSIRLDSEFVLRFRCSDVLRFPTIFAPSTKATALQVSHTASAIRRKRSADIALRHCKSTTHYLVYRSFSRCLLRKLENTSNVSSAIPYSGPCTAIRATAPLKNAFAPSSARMHRVAATAPDV